MDEFKARQLAQMRFGIEDFRCRKLSLGALVSRLEGAARAVGQEFWERDVFATVADLEQINVDLVEERREPTSLEYSQVELLIAQLETRLSHDN